jgi:hypothetical protein
MVISRGEGGNLRDAKSTSRVKISHCATLPNYPFSQLLLNLLKTELD